MNEGRFGRGAGALLLSSLLCGCAHPGTASSFSGTEPWQVFTSPHFEVETPLDDAAARTLVTKLEQYRGALGVTLGVELPNTRLKVIAFAKTGELAALGFPPEVAGFVRFDADQVFMGLQPTSERQSVPLGPVQAHELAHYFMSFLFQTRPRWFSEGMADYLGAIELGTADFVVGRANAMRIGQARYHLSLEQLWGWDVPNSELKNGRSAYASAWLWVHFLLNAHRDRFTGFMQGLARGQPARAAFERAFAGIPAAQLEQQVGDYVRTDQRYEVVRFPNPPLAGPVSVRPISAAGALWARYLVSTSPEVDAALSREAAQKFPGSIEALLIEATRARPVNPIAERALQAAGSDDPRVALHLAAHCEALPAGACEDLTRRAVELCPEEPVALRARLQQLHATGDDVGALAMVQRLLRVAPFSHAALSAAVWALAAQGRCDDALAVSQRAAAAIPEALDEAARVKLRLALENALGSCRP